MVSAGVFWLIDDKLLAISYMIDATEGLSKSGTNYNHKFLWESVRPANCSKAFDYYPRGRVEIRKKGAVVFMSPHIGTEYVPKIMECFGLTEKPRIHYDGSRHYRCHLDAEN